MRFTLEPPSAPQEKPVALRLAVRDGRSASLEAWTGRDWSAIIWLDPNGKAYRHILYDEDKALGFQVSADGRIAIENPASE